MTILRWSAQASDLKSIQLLGWISEGNVHRADTEAGIVEYLPHGGRTARPGVRIIHPITALLRFDEVKDAVFTRIFSGHECGPGWRCDRRTDGLKWAVGTPLHQFGEIRQTALGHPRLDQRPSGGVQTDHNDLWDFLHCSERLDAIGCPVKRCAGR